MDKYFDMGQGRAVELSPEDHIRDEIGLTNPNLHRRVESTDTTYTLGIYGLDSWRTSSNTYDDASDLSEIP